MLPSYYIFTRIDRVLKGCIQGLLFRPKYADTIYGNQGTWDYLGFCIPRLIAFMTLEYPLIVDAWGVRGVLRLNSVATTLPQSRITMSHRTWGFRLWDSADYTAMLLMLPTL